jgi:hypothetical protein
MKEMCPLLTIYLKTMSIEMLAKTEIIQSYLYGRLGRDNGVCMWVCILDIRISTRSITTQK